MSSSRSGSKAKGGGKKSKQKAKKGGGALHKVSRFAISRGFLGGSRPWTVIASLTVAVRVMKKLFSGTPATVFSETLRPGDCLVISHDREARVVRAPS